MDRETRDMYNLLLNQLESMNKNINIKFGQLEERFDKVEVRQGILEEDLDNLTKRIDKIENVELKDLKVGLRNIEERQDEIYKIVSVMEESTKVTRAKIERMSFNLAEQIGKVTKLEEAVVDHAGVIEQIRAIK